MKQDLIYKCFCQEMEFLNSVLSQPRHEEIDLNELYQQGLQDISQRYHVEVEDLDIYYNMRFKR